jgi:hypothetical protein
MGKRLLAAMFLLLYEGRSQTVQHVERLLPASAKILETAEVGSKNGRKRQLVFWMQDPKRVVRPSGIGYCGDIVEGDHWIGPARLSLVDSNLENIINTVRISSREVSESDDIPIPFWVSNNYWIIPSPGPNREGRPKILALRDLTGEGFANQFVLFLYDACGIVSTSVVGYSKQMDRVLQYRVELSEKGENPHSDFWIEQVFARPPMAPGRWKVTWSPHHGVDDVVTDDLSFDKARQVFVDRQVIQH